MNDDDCIDYKGTNLIFLYISASKLNSSAICWSVRASSTASSAASSGPGAGSGTDASCVFRSSQGHKSSSSPSLCVPLGVVGFGGGGLGGFGGGGLGGFGGGGLGGFGGGGLGGFGGGGLGGLGGGGLGGLGGGGLGGGGAGYFKQAPALQVAWALETRSPTISSRHEESPKAQLRKDGPLATETAFVESIPATMGHPLGHEHLEVPHATVLSVEEQ